MGRSFFDFIKSEKGFSLPEVMIGGAILAGVGLAGAYMFKEQKTSQKKIDNEQKLSIYHQALVKAFSNSQLCNATLNTYYNTAIPNASLTVYPCRDPDPTPPDVCLGTSNSRGDASNVQANTSLTPLYQANTWIDQSRYWKIGSIDVIDGPYTKTGRLRIAVSYDINPELVKQGGNTIEHRKTIRKDILLNVRFDKNGGFKECLNNQESSVNNLSSELCKTMNSGLIDSTGNAATWDEAQQKCVLKGENSHVSGTKLKECGAGHVIEGLRSDGTVHCRPIDQGFTGFDNNTINSTNTTCPSGTRLRYNANTKNMVIECY